MTDAAIVQHWRAWILTPPGLVYIARRVRAAAHAVVEREAKVRRAAQPTREQRRSSGARLWLVGPLLSSACCGAAVALYRA